MPGPGLPCGGSPASCRVCKSGRGRISQKSGPSFSLRQRALPCRDGLGSAADLFGVAEIVVAYETQRVVEFEDVGYGRRQVERGDPVVGDSFEMLDDASQRIAVCDDQQAVVPHQRREDDAVPVGQDACDRLFERFGARQFGVGNAGVAHVETRVARVVLGQRVGGHVVAPSPDVYLLLAVFFGCFAFVEPLQHSVVFFVEPP